LGEYDKALTYFQRSLDLILETGNQYGIAETFINIGKLQILMNNMQDAYANISQGLKFASDIGAQHLTMNGYLALSDYFKANNNSDESLRYFRLHSGIKDDILSEEMTQKISNIQAQYEMREIEHEIVRLEKNNQIMKLKDDKRNLFLLLLFASLMILTGLLIFQIKRFKNNKTNSKQLQNEVLERMTSEKRLIKRLKIEKIITKISARFINISDFILISFC